MLSSNLSTFVLITTIGHSGWVYQKRTIAETGGTALPMLAPNPAAVSRKLVSKSASRLFGERLSLRDSPIAYGGRHGRSPVRMPRAWGDCSVSRASWQAASRALKRGG